MFLFTLVLHIFSALVMTATTFFVMISIQTKKQTKAYPAMLYSFLVTAVSGLGLVVLHPNELGHFCIVMSSFTIAVALTRHFYRKQLTDLI